LVALIGLGGCSLISIKSPERPLSTRDLNARILTRQYSTDFIDTVNHSADEIAVGETDPTVLTNTLRWKIAATTESRHAATQIAPMMAVLDTWTLAVQMKDFLTPGAPGGQLFGHHQQLAVSAASELQIKAESLARQLIPPGDFARYQQFVDTYTREHPLQSLEFLRPSVVAAWTQQGGPEIKLVDSLGTIPEAVTDASERVQILSDTLAAQTLWQTQLALRQSRFTGDDVQAALKRLDERLAHMSTLADNAPELVHDALIDVRASVIDVLKHVDASTASMIMAVRTERLALADTVEHEREAIFKEAEAQRRDIVLDAGRLSDRIVSSSGREVRRLVRETLLLLTLLAVVVLGMPFIAGYLVGRGHRTREHR
jgi:hypothetical protein